MGFHPTDLVGSAMPMRQIWYLFIVCALCLMPRRVLAEQPTMTTAASIGDSVLADDVRVTLLDLRRLSADEYRATGCNSPDLWPGGGFHAAFLVENRPGQPILTVLGEVRVFVGSHLYNPVTNSSSSKPLAPCIVVHDIDDFFRTNYGRRVKQRATERARTITGVVEVFIRGEYVPKDSAIVIELEQGGTHMREDDKRYRAPGRDEVNFQWFRFVVPRLD
jgi:hypothetical protein